MNQTRVYQATGSLEILQVPGASDVSIDDLLDDEALIIKVGSKTTQTINESSFL